MSLRGFSLPLPKTGGESENKKSTVLVAVDFSIGERKEEFDRHNRSNIIKVKGRKLRFTNKNEIWRNSSGF